MHVFKDLQPYICTFEGCHDILVTFPTRKLWSDHECSVHRQRQFFACYQCRQELETEEIFRQHLEGAHLMHLNHEQFLAAASAARVKPQKPVTDEQCPLCLKSGWTSVRALTTHVGRHMEGIALASLPRNGEFDLEADDESQSTRSQPRLKARGSPNAPSVPTVSRSESPRRSGSPVLSSVSPNDLRTDHDEGSSRGIEGKLLCSPQASPFGEEEPTEEQRPRPNRGRGVFKDLEAHMLTRQPERSFEGPLKCPVWACEFHIKGFTRRCDQTQHTLTHYKGTIVCYFCSGVGSAAEKSFGRADVFKRHLSSVHGVKQRRLPSLFDYSRHAFSNCSTCSATFTNVHVFYEHLDLCVLRAVLATEAVDPEAKVELERSMEMMILKYTPTTGPEKCDRRHLDSEDQNPATTKDERNFAIIPQEHPLGHSTSQSLEDTAQAGASGPIPAIVLYRAAERGYEATVRFLLDQGADATAKDENGETVLHQAAKGGHEATVRLLLDQGADATAKDENGETALHQATKGGHETTVRLLLDQGADATAKDENGETALHRAAKGGHEATVRLLLDQGADATAKDDNGETALHRAAKGGHETTVRLLLDQGADATAKDKNGETALHRAAERGHETTVRLLLDQGADATAKDENGETALHRAAERGHEATVRLLLNQGADATAKDKNGETVPHRAAKGGHATTVRLLLDQGADATAKDKNGETALHRAAKGGHETTVKILLDEGADATAKDENGETVLHQAARHEATVRLLLDQGADATAKDKNGETVLHRAAKGGHETTVRLLLDQGADATAKDKNGETALHWAAKGGHETTVKILLDQGADATAKDENGETVLHQAARHEATVRLLLDQGADATAKDKNGETVLHRAAKGGHETTVRLLLDRGADATAKDKNGETALHWAAKRGCEAIVQPLLEKLFKSPEPISYEGFESERLSNTLTRLYINGTWYYNSSKTRLL